MNRMLAVLVAAILALTLAPAVSLAASPSQQQCEAAGGEFTRERGTVTCTFTTEDPVGNSERSGGRSQSTTTTGGDSSKGTLQNDPQYEELPETCDGPGNSGASSAHCS